jgi:predicted nucleic acid-binding protein
MSRGLADTSIFIAHESGREIRADLIPDSIAVSVITIGELRAGVLASDSVAVRDARLATLTSVLALDPVPVDQSVAEAWATLRVALRDQGLRMLVNDSWIAATSISLGIPIVTQDDDYLHAPGLEVIHV